LTSILENRLYLIAAAVSFVASLLLTPLVRRLAHRFGVVDKPDEYRKLHSQAIPLGGGVAILIAFLLSLFVVFTSSR
jgi:UDP-GlcNAc:undecaprenyl-phosphate GlcNAc-1-phosphate transferase